jgi:hypothetical protein
MYGLGSSVGDPNIRDPVAPSAPQTRLNIFTFEVCRGLAKTRLVDILKCVDIDDSVQMIVDLTGDEWYRSATRTNVKRGGSSSEGVL